MEAHNVSWSEARFNASGIVEVVLPIGVELSETTIRQAVLNADRLRPWRNSSDLTTAPGSIYWHNEPEMVGEGGGVDRLYQMRIRPLGLLKPSQFAAYHQYLMGIASEVAMMQLPNVICVRARPIFSGVYGSYRIPAEERGQTKP